MRVATLLIVLYGAGTGAAVAHPLGVEVRTDLGDVVAHGSSPAVDWNLTVKRRRFRVFPPPQAPYQVGARAYPIGLELVLRCGGHARARGGSVALIVAGPASRLVGGASHGVGAARATADGFEVRTSYGAVRAVGAATARAEGIPLSVRYGLPVGHPTEAEAEQQRERADEEDLLLLVGE